MKRVYNYNTGKLYESDGTYRIYVEEISLDPDVEVDPNTKGEIDEMYFSFDEADRCIDIMIDELLRNEGLSEDDVEIEATDNGKCVVSDGYKKWCFTISKDVDEGEGETERGKHVNEFMAGGNDYMATFSDLERSTNVNQDLRHIFIDLHTIGQWYSGLVKVANGEFSDKVGSYLYAFRNITSDDAKYMIEIMEPIIGLLSNKTMDADDDPDHQINVNDLIALLPCLREIARMSGKNEYDPRNIISAAARRLLNNISELKPSSNESVSMRFSKLRSMFEAAGLNEDNEDDENDEEGGSSDEEKGKKEKDEPEEDGDDGDEDEEEEKDLKAIIITVKKGDEDKCKEGMVDAGVSEDDIDILEGDEDDDTVDIRIDVNSVYELKDYLKKHDIDLEEEIGGEICDDDSDEEGDENPEGEDGEDGDEEGEEEFDFNDLGDIFGADDEE